MSTSSHPDDRPSGRVLHVINSLGVSGGAEQQLVSNLAAFRDSRLEHHVAYLYEYDFETRTADAVAAASSVTPVMGSDGKRSRLGTIKKLDHVVRDIGPDLIHCSLADAALASRVVGRRRRIPVVESLVNISHDPVRTIDNPAVTRPKLALHRLVDRLTMRSVARFHALTDAVKESWVESVGIDAEKVTVIPRGVDMSRLDATMADGPGKPQLLAELGLPLDSEIVLSVGRQEAQKGQRYLVQAMRSLVEASPSRVLLIAGRPGNAATTLQELVAELGLEDHVRILGRRTDVPALIAACDVFAFPSLFEGLGVALLEAMACAAPIVTTDAPPMNAVLRSGVDGLTVAPRDIAALASAIGELLHDPGRARALGASARQRVSDEFALPDTAWRVEQLYLDELGLD